MAILIYNPEIEADARRLWAGRFSDSIEETWDGVTVLSPSPNNEHQDLQAGLLLALGVVIREAGLGQVFAGVNVSDRADGWTHNYRIPDLAVYLHDNPAVDRQTFWHGGPDFMIEMVSPGEDPHAKLGFYAQVNTREVLIVHRHPWRLELFALADGRLDLAGTSDMVNPAALFSAAVGLSFRLVAGTRRPQIEVTHPPTGRVWLA